MDAKQFITNQLGTVGWAPINRELAEFLNPEARRANLEADQHAPEALLRVFPRTTLCYASIEGFGVVPVLYRSPLVLAERIGFLTGGTVEILNEKPKEPARQPAAQPVTSDALALRHVGIETREPPRPCKQCRNLGAGVACIAAQRGELEGAPRDYHPDTQWPRRCLSYVPPSPDRDEILGRDGRTGRELWPEIAG